MLSLCLLPMFVALAAASCGTPDRSHPPKLRMSSNSIDGLGAGIVGGAEAEPHSYPWQVWIFKTKPGSNSGFACGGSLIAPNWIVTASHCVVDDKAGRQVASPDRFKIFLGQHSKWQGTEVSASRVIKHPGYSGTSSGNGNDIALIKLSSNANYNDKIQPICLPSSSDSWRKDGEGLVVSGALLRNTHTHTLCWLKRAVFKTNTRTGWGALATGAAGPNELHHVVLRSEFSTCQRKWHLSSNEMCALGNAKDSCQGDSGGPLVARRNSRFVLAGVVSYGGDCAAPDLPAVYAHVPSFRDWIKQNTGV